MIFSIIDCVIIQTLHTTSTVICNNETFDVKLHPGYIDVLIHLELLENYCSCTSKVHT